MHRKLADSDVFGHLQREMQASRRFEETLPILRRRELVEREISADNRKGLGVLRDAFRLKPLLRELAACGIAVAAVDLAAPSLVLPRTRADPNALARER